MFVELFKEVLKTGVKKAKTAISKITSGVKRANQRMRELEKRGLEDYSSSYKSLKDIWTMENSQNIPKNKRITGTTKDGKPKFNTSVSTLANSEDDFQAMTQYLENFMESDTSTTPGAREVKETIEKSYNSFKENNPEYEDLTQDEYEDIWTHNLYDYLRQFFSSTDSAYLVSEVVSGRLDENKIREIVESAQGEISVYEVWQYAQKPTDDEFTEYNEEDNPFI